VYFLSSLHFAMFDIFSGVSGIQDTPVVAESYGGPFKVYSTRDFPGLEPSTELTKVHIRRSLFAVTCHLSNFSLSGIPEFIKVRCARHS